MRYRSLRRALRPRTNRSGQAIVELALVAPVLFLIIFGLIDFARGWSAHHAIADAAREGTRMLVIYDPSTDTADAGAAIRQRLDRAGLDPSRAQITYVEGAERGQPTTVTIDYTFDFWLLGAFMTMATGDERIHLVSQITMRKE